MKEQTDIIGKLFYTDTGKIIVSIILGLGIAALFRKECNDNNCIVIKGPNPKEIEKYYYKLNGECHKYTPYVVDCASSSNMEADL